MSRTRANAQGGMMRNLNSAPTPELEDYLSSNRVRAQSTKATGGYVRKTMHNNGEYPEMWSFHNVNNTSTRRQKPGPVRNLSKGTVFT
uniref:Uncharacterized protein n=1 Tax=Moniliophthora roreri TaxID=221103 RepID=A0A0W0EVX8_MONRR